MKAPEHIHEVQQSPSSSISSNNTNQNSQSNATAPSHTKTVAEVKDNNDMPITGQSSPLPFIGLTQLVIVSGLICAWLVHRIWKRKRAEA